MNYQKIGPVEIFMGENQSRMPFSTSLAIRGRENSTLIDCGSGNEAFQYLKNNHNIKQIYLTHHHIDHIWGAHQFPDVDKYINPLDFRKVSDLNEIIKAQGIKAVFNEIERNEWEQNQNNLLMADGTKGKRTLEVTHSYFYDCELELSDTTVIMIHAPGHTEGYCCPYLPEHGILFVGDFDLTSFGPFYCDAEGNIDHFIRSAQKTLEVDAKYFVTAHQKGTLTKDEYAIALRKYLNIIEKRDEKIRQFIKKGNLPQDLMKLEVFYYEYQLMKSRFYMKSEKVGIVKHLRRLIEQGEPFGDFFEAFLDIYNIDMKYIDYQSEHAEKSKSR